MNQELFIHKYIPGADSRTPTLILLHGTGGNEDSLIEVGQELMPSAHFLSLRGNILENGMPRFFRRLSEGIFDLDNLHEQTVRLKHFIESARMAYGLEASPVVLVGYSNGANIAASLLLSSPQVIQGAVLFRPMLPFQPDKTIQLKSKTPVLLLSGEHDTLVSKENVTTLVQELGKAGTETQLHWIPTGHQLGYGDILYAQEWLTAHFL